LRHKFTIKQERELSPKKREYAASLAGIASDAALAATLQRTA
jgi:hypothetical protein